MRNFTIEAICPRCRKVHPILVNIEDYLDWHAGMRLTQEAFPYLNADEREMLISGTCPTCWDEMFGIDDEEAV